MGVMRHTYRILVGKLERKRLLQVSEWEDNVRMDLTEIGWQGVDFIFSSSSGTSDRLL
jgi:hypothetical protein